MELIKAILIASVFGNLYSVLHHGLLFEFSLMWSSAVKALGWSFLAQRMIQQENN